jgi:ATP-dependent RNA circularization protein (DNA/RNA ligase family)
MRTYEKIQTLYERDTEGSKKLLIDKWRSPEVEMLKDIPWDWTEKIDGTNVRVYWDGHSVSFGGRTNNSSIPAELMNRLFSLFGGETNAQLFEQTFGDREVILYGEGCGRKIQAVGSQYYPDSVEFLLFDLMVGGNYQPRDSVERCARTFGVHAVPFIKQGTLDEAVEFVRSNPDSRIGTAKMEGLVCRPVHELQDRCGNRIIVKIKYKDFKDM